MTSTAIALTSLLRSFIFFLADKNARATAPMACNCQTTSLRQRTDRFLYLRIHADTRSLGTRSDTSTQHVFQTCTPAAMPVHSISIQVVFASKELARHPT